MKTKIITLILLTNLFVWNAIAQTQIWGTCTIGGLNGDGTIFSTDGNGNNFHKVYDFLTISGKRPLGSMVLANNGSFYGVTALGGFGDSCVCYRYNPMTGVFTDIHDLYQFMNLGYGSQSGMLQASDGNLYGLCPEGGANNYGVIYKIDPSNDTYTDIYDFSLSSGCVPHGSLMEATNGNLYGLTYGGGSYNKGVIFEYNPSTSSFTKLFDFGTATGAWPYYGKLLEASNGKLYGVTDMGGTNSRGVIFCYDISNNSYSDVYNFPPQTNPNYYGLKTGLIQATNGKLYGTVCPQNDSTFGFIYSFDIITNSFVDIYDFDSINGLFPQRALIQGSNGKLFGTTNSGGAHEVGVVYSYDITTSTYTKLFDFDYGNTNSGYSPDCELMETSAITGIASFKTLPSLKIFPNPATDYINIISSDKEETIQFIDVLGRELETLKTTSFGKTHVDVSSFPNVFFVKSKDGVQKVVRK